jgi:hypothetical protein
MTQDGTETHALTRDELLALPASIDIVTAGRAFGVGRTTAYALARSGEFPCQVIRAGRAYRVITADLLRVLHITPDTGVGLEVQSGSAA